MTQRTRMLALAGVVTIVVIATSAYVVNTVRDRKHKTDQTKAVAIPVPTGPRIVFRNTSLDGTNGEVAAVPLDNPSGPRAYVGPVCDRVDAVAEQLVCSKTNRGVATTFAQQVYDGGKLVESWSLPGIPSRTRFSPSGKLVADTVFVSGHSYMQVGFSTATEIRDTSGHSLGNLETWRVYVDGKRFEKADRNVWGVTFLDDSTFYATVASGNSTWLVKGDLTKRTLTSVRGNAECPSISPDHSHVAYKKRIGGGMHWSIAVLDLASGAETVLDETRSVDDQVTWLDDSTLLYGMPRENAAGLTDIWRIATVGTTDPQIYIKNAWSPAVVT
jgi:hypothetical protein